MIGNMIQPKFLTDLELPGGGGPVGHPDGGMLVGAAIYARVLGTEDVTLAAGAA